MDVLFIVQQYILVDIGGSHRIQLSIGQMHEKPKGVQMSSQKGLALTIIVYPSCKYTHFLISLQTGCICLLFACCWYVRTQKRDTQPDFCVYYVRKKYGVAHLNALGMFLLLRTNGLQLRPIQSYIYIVSMYIHSYGGRRRKVSIAQCLLLAATATIQIQSRESLQICSS